MNQVIIGTILALAAITGSFFLGTRYQQGEVAKKEVKLNIERNNKLAELKSQEAAIQNEIDRLKVRSTASIEKRIAGIKIVYRDKPLYIYKEEACIPSEDFIRAYSDIVKSTKE